MKKLIHLQREKGFIGRIAAIVGIVVICLGGINVMAQAPANDDLANAQVLKGTNATASATTVGATTELDEPAHAGYPAAHSIWFDWTAPDNGSVLLDLTGSAPGTDLAVYVGKYMGSLTTIASNAFANPDKTGRCVFQAVAGVVYEVAVDVDGAPGSVQLSLQFTTTYFPPQITQQPASQSAIEGTTAVFSVQAQSSSPLSFQWMFQGTNLAGATNSTLQLTNLALSQAGAYQVVVSNQGGSTNSQSATLTVFSRPVNDDFANSITLSGTSATVSGSNLFASLEPGEPSHAGWASGASVWWNWSAPDTGIVSVSVNNYSPGNQILDIYTGGSLGQLALVVDNSQWFSPPLAAQFVASKGTNYQIAVTGVNQGEGTFQLSLSFTPTNFPPVITNQPGDQTAIPGGTASFQVSVSSALPLTYQWFFDTSAPLAGATTSSLTLSNILSSQAGGYQVAVSNASGYVLSGQASLTVNVPPANDNFASSAPVSGLSVTTTGNNRFATSEPNEPPHAGYGPGASVWWNWTAPSIGDASVNVTGFSGAETLAVYTGTTLIQLHTVASNNWNKGPVSVHFPAGPGTNYQIAVSDPNSVGGSFQLQVQLALSNFPPGIITQPPAITNVIAGSTFQFLYYVTNDFYVTNLWYFQPSSGGEFGLIGGGDGYGDGWGTGGGTGGTGGSGGFGGYGGGGGGGDGAWDLWLNVTNVTTNQSGYYYTVVTSIGGSVTNAAVLLIVHPPPSNDNFTNKFPLMGAIATASGSTAYSTLETNEPTYSGLTNGGSVWWTWTAPDSGTESISVTNTLGAFQVVQIYTGDSLTNLVPIARSAGAQKVLSTSFITTPGTAYQIAVAGGESPIQLGLQFTDANIPPLITQQPMDVTVGAGGPASFQVGASGGGVLSYQWFFDSTTPLTGQTNLSLNLVNVTAAQAGSYSVTVTNLGGSVSSRQAALTVNLRPSNDNFANRTPITETNFTTTASDQNATFESGEPPYPGGFTMANSVWWTWTAPTDGRLTVTVTNSPLEIQILAIYTGSSLLGLSSVASSVTYSATVVAQCIVTAETPYQIAVAAPNGSGGPFQLNLNFVSVVFPPVITSQPLSATVTNGNSAMFQVAASGAGPLSCQWQFSGTNLPGATNFTLQLSNIATDQAGNYNAVVTNPGGSTNSRVAVLRVLQSPPNDNFTNRITLTGEETNVIGSNNYGSSEPDEPAHAGFGPFSTVWWSYTPPALGIIEVNLSNSFNGAVVAIYTGTNVAQLTLLASNAMGNPDGTGSVTFRAQAGTQYQIAVQGSSAASSGNIDLSLTGIFPPTIANEPQSQAVAQGETAGFDVTSRSEGPLNYQWSFNGTQIFGATNQHLSIQNASSNNLGSYSVLVSDEVGSVMSTDATLTFTSVLVGQVTDATTGEPVTGVKVWTGTVTNYTDTNGNYRLAGVQSSMISPDFDANVRSGPAPLDVQFFDRSSMGTTVLLASSNGYYTYTNASVTVVNGQFTTNSFSISPILAPGSMRLVLNWDANPRDLDAHLVTPVINGQSYHIYYQTGSRGNLTNSPYAALDHDATNGFGPETITIAQFFAGTYQYYVHRYAGTGTVAGSGATVKIYTTAGLTQTLIAPATGDGDYWQVVDIDGASQNVTLIDQIGTNAPALLPSQKKPQPRVPAPLLPSYLWTFGDGTNSALENPAHTYANAGLYTVSLTVTDSNNVAQTATKTNFIQVVAPPIITQQPASLINNQGADVEFSVTATGPAPLTYQWWYNQTNLISSGETSMTLSLQNVTTNAAGSYSVVVANAYGSATSSVATLIVIPPSSFPPVITLQPISTTTNQGATVVFEVDATGTPPLSYQWQFNGQNMPGATDQILAFFNLLPYQGGTYTAVVTNAAGSAVSSNAFLKIIAPPKIIQQPANVIVNQGSSATFTIGVAGSSPLSYQWQLGGLPIPGATESSLSLTSTTVTNIGYYSVVVSNPAGAATTQNASLTFLDLRMCAGITISSPVAAYYSLQALQGFGGTNWTTFTNVTAGPQPSIYIDYNSATNSIQFYRAILVP